MLEIKPGRDSGILGLLCPKNSINSMHGLRKAINRSGIATSPAEHQLTPYVCFRKREVTLWLHSETLFVLTG